MKNEPESKTPPPGIGGARIARATYATAEGTEKDPRDITTKNLITDLLHLANHEGWEVEWILDEAIRGYREESK